MNYQNEKNTKYSATNDLIEIENNFKNYYEFIVNFFYQNFPDIDDLRILDFGAGIGTICSGLKEKFNLVPDCFEIDSNHITILEKNNFKVYSNINDLEMYDVIYSSNVFEHIKDDNKSLGLLYNKLNPGGSLLVYVPAFMSNFSDLDRTYGHYRRFDKIDLFNKLTSKKFIIKNFYYVDCMGFFVSIFFKIFGFRKTLRKGSFFHYVYDNLIFRISIFLDKIFRKYFGKIIFVYAPKKW